MPAPTKNRTIELLAPAKNVSCAREAILHGADAVYIGAPKFGARAAAGNEMSDLADLVVFAHRYRVRIYVTLNVLLYDEELTEAEKLIWDLWKIGVDALIIQDMGILEMNLPPIPLHASTQMDNLRVEKVRFLEDAGFRQVVLARELSLKQIWEIAAATTVPLETFIHGALCVSYSGQCYLSRTLSGRSANRGECAQYCRLPYNLEDADGKVLIRQKHLLSMKDLNRTAHLESLIDAGVSSFKIEGRLKDESYVKNITAWYRQKLDEIMLRRPELKRASSGFSKWTFTPNPQKSFNRGFTDYFTKGRPDQLTNPNTPKSIGEPVGRVKELRGGSLTVAGLTTFTNGDGLCFFDEQGNMEGFRVNRADQNRLFPAQMPRVKPQTALYRTFDQAFERELERSSAQRFIPVALRCWETPFGFALSMEDQEGHRAMLSFEQELVAAAKPQKERVSAELCKLGNTLFEATSCYMDWKQEWFVPVSKWAEMRRLLCEKMEAVRMLDFRREEYRLPSTSHSYPESKLTYLGNVLNYKAKAFYEQHGVQQIDPAFEARPFCKEERMASPSEVLMFNKFCLKYELGACPRMGKMAKTFHEPLFLVYNQQRIQLNFDCKICEMHLTLAE